MKAHSGITQKRWFSAAICATRIVLSSLTILFLLPQTPALARLSTDPLLSQKQISTPPVTTASIGSDNPTLETLTTTIKVTTDNSSISNVATGNLTTDDTTITSNQPQDEFIPPSDNITSSGNMTSSEKVVLQTSVIRNITFIVNTNGDIEIKSPSSNTTNTDGIGPGDAENITGGVTNSENITGDDVASTNTTPSVILSENISVGNITLRFPKDAVSAATEVEFIERAPIGSTGTKMLRLFELNAKDVQSGEPVTQFSRDIEIKIRHGSGDLDGLDSSSLKLYYLNNNTRQWQPLESRFDSRTGVLTASTNHFTNFGEQANPLQNGPGRVMAAEVSLNAGTATFSYPIELPPGPGDFQPELQLSYNSGSVDGMKNKRDMGSWVGIGWSLNLGRISMDDTTKECSLDLNGGSYALVSVNATEFRTSPDQYFKITRNTDNSTWEVLDKNGTYYRFGGTDDSKQYVYDNVTATKSYYRWDLSLMRDTNSNNATVTYARDIVGAMPDATWVRSAYPEYLRYGGAGGVVIHLISSNNATDGSDHVRKDNPKTALNSPAPKVMENRYLDSITVSFNGTLVRKYAFTYNTTDSVYSSDYGGTYYSGSHTLTSITQVGTDNSSLPSTSFAYQDLQTFRHTTEGAYVGNPGNPASLWWPYLTKIDSGYGGAITFAYAQVPNVTQTNIWTRQVVISKTASDGINSDQTQQMTFYTHADTGTPGVDGQVQAWGDQYNGPTWSQMHDGTGSYSYPSSTEASVYLRQSYNSGWYVLNRVITGFDTSTLPSNAIITSAVVSIVGSDKSDSGGFAPSINVYSAAPASNSDLDAGDYDSLGTTPFSTAIPYADFIVGNSNYFQLNAAGIASINMTGVTNFGWRDVVGDVANAEPACPYLDHSSLAFYTADGGSAPKLVVNYTTTPLTKTEIHSYTYTGNPEYEGTGWDQQYRGFYEVKETDATGNYLKHWYYTTGIVNGKKWR